MGKGRKSKTKTESRTFCEEWLNGTHGKTELLATEISAYVKFLCFWSIFWKPYQPGLEHITYFTLSLKSKYLALLEKSKICI